MVKDEFQAISNIGRALWANPSKSNYVSEETLVTVSVLNLDLEQSIERATLALLNRAKRDGSRANLDPHSLPFYHLEPEERFVLSALHVAHWPYSKLLKLMGTSEFDLSTLAWKARINLATSFLTTDIKNTLKIQLPTGPTHLKPNCPEYDPEKPWTQKFLDDEFYGKEQVYMRNHLMACDSCRNTLHRCREFYYKIDGLIPQIKDKKELNQLSTRLASVWATLQKDRLGMTFLQSLKIFFARSEVKVVLILFVAAIAALTLL